MALSAGSITVDAETGAHTGDGMAFAMFDAWWTAIGGDARYTDLDTRVLVKEGMAALLVAIATGAVDHITTNAEVTVTVTTTTEGLQRLPDPPSAGSATVGPAADVDLAGTIS